MLGGENVTVIDGNAIWCGRVFLEGRLDGICRTQSVDVDSDILGNTGVA